MSTLNRELAKHLARQPDVAITLLLPNCSEKEKQEANDHNVHLALSDEMTEFGPSEDFDIDVIVGHGQKVGAPAQVIAEQHSCKRVHVVHTASEELAMFKKRKKAISEGEEKHDAEIDLCKEADIVVAIGPKLTEAISANLRPYGKDQDVINFTPGIFPEFLKLSQAIEERKKFRILVFGRGDSDVFELKGYDIAAQAVASLKDTSYHLLFVGAPKGNEEEVKDYLVDCGISSTQLTVRGFVKSREKLEQLFCEVDLAIMPSRTEGFGLTALEALSAGLPILVSDNSGFGQAIKSVNFGSSFVVHSCDAEEWGKAIRSVREKPRQIRLNEALWLRKFYDEKYKWEPQCERLASRMRWFFE